MDGNDTISNFNNWGVMVVARYHRSERLRLRGPLALDTRAIGHIAWSSQM